MHDALVYFGDPWTTDTQKCVLMFDRFFDCLNVRSLTEWIVKNKSDRKPYKSCKDSRLEVTIQFKYFYFGLILAAHT